MKKLFIILFLLLTINAGAQWLSDVRLTTDSAFSSTSTNNAWCVASSGSFVHVVWYDNRNGNYQIYYKRSIDAGSNWGTDIRLSNTIFVSRTPSIAVSGSVVHVVWRDNRDGNDEIYCKSSTDGGVNWGPDSRLTNNSADSWYPCVAVSGTLVFVVWKDNREFYDKLFCKRSTDGGLNWEQDVRLTNYNGMSLFPSVSISGSAVHIVWYDNRDGNDEIYYKRSIDGGSNWGPDTRLTNNAEPSISPSIAVAGSFINVVWSDGRYGPLDIFYKRSTDGGVNWEADTRLTNDTNYSYLPSVAVSGPVVHTVWRDTRDGTKGIFYKRSTNSGLNWSADSRLSNDTADIYNPSVSVSGSVVNVVWYDNRVGNNEIYYKRNPTGNPIGIQNISSEIPSSFSLSQNYPNPFNPSTKIRFQIPYSEGWQRNADGVGLVTLKVFDISSKEVATLVNEQLQPGTYETDWNASSFSSGVYFYKIVAGNFSETRKMILMK